jgi:pimeloyl-ACP methyl ester carboxylesterase
METFDRWADEAERIEVGGLSLAVHDVGEGPVATYLHGYPSSTLDAIPLIDRLDGVRVVAPDLPGFGASDKPVGHPYSIHGAVDAVEAIWDRLGVTSSVLVAHDYSVSVAQELLARQAESPDRPVTVTGVVWSNGGLYPDLHRPTYGQQLLLDPDHGAEIAAAMDETAFANGIRITWGERRPMGDARQAHALLHYVADRRAHADRWRAALEASAVPMYFVWGELDPVSGGHVAERLAERLPSVPLLRLQDVGHWPPLEAPDEMAAAVRELVG